MVAVRQALYRRVRSLHPWLPMPDVKAALARSQEVIDTQTMGGAALIVGSVLRQWDTGAFDGAVLTACWGCDNRAPGARVIPPQGSTISSPLPFIALRPRASNT
ncbi:MAG: hypothetical protein ACYC8T_27750 [Myxococcaceae bacterium]